MCPFSTIPAVGLFFLKLNHAQPPCRFHIRSHVCPPGPGRISRWEKDHGDDAGAAADDANITQLLSCTEKFAAVPSHTRIATSQNRFFNHLHFRDCETESWRHSVTCPTFHSKWVAELGFDSECDPKASSLNDGDALIFFSLSSICCCLLKNDTSNTQKHACYTKSTETCTQLMIYSRHHYMIYCMCWVYNTHKVQHNRKHRVRAQ